MDSETIPEAVIGQTLRSISALLFGVSDEDGPSDREAISLQFDSVVLSVRALTDTSELSVNTEALSLPTSSGLVSCSSIADISDHQPLAALVGKRLRSWWSLENDAGYRDGFMVAFAEHEAVCFIAMNNTVSVLSISGEQCS